MKKERPILFSTPMVQAILDERKTQTRRRCKVYKFPYGDRNETGWPMVCDQYGDWHKEKCPYGAPGDRLWVRETWRPYWHSELWMSIQYKADNAIIKPKNLANKDGYKFQSWFDDWQEEETCRAWKPSIHMPRWASRITLEVTTVRVERVQEITEADAITEGVEPFSIPNQSWIGGATPAYKDYTFLKSKLSFCLSAKKSFQTLWDSINAAKGFGWDANPWVWVVEFKRIQP